MATGINAAMNGFLALLEGRPEDARQMFAPHLLSSGADLATITGRIQRARDNIKCRAVQDAIRGVYDQTLRLDPPQHAPLKEIAEGEILKETRYKQALDDAFLQGVQAVEEILADMLEMCRREEIVLGPNLKNLP